MIKPLSIQGLMHEGTWITDPLDIKSAFLNFYKEKFRCHDSPVIIPSMLAAKRLSDLDRDFLDSMVSLEEIKLTVWDCVSQKASVYIVTHLCLSRSFGTLLKFNIHTFVVNFFSTSTFPQGLNLDFISFIPKVSNPLFIKDYRPILLIGIHYKIIDKILANRSAKVIASIISHEQSIFIAGRQILDGPFVLSEVIDCASEDKKKLAWIKWPNLLASFDKGGLGVGSLKAFNRCMLLKWRWRLLSSSGSLWVNVVKSIHIDEAGMDLRVVKLMGYGLVLLGR
nr:RNA-directed DNA polymerase, eukaryota [Tanacetum cinerariifolium]